MPKPRTRAPFFAFALLAGLYYFTFIHAIFARRYLPGGDTLLGHSLFYSVLQAIEQFSALPWWDPSITNGYPLYFNFLAGEMNVLAIHNLPFLAAFKALGFLGISTSSWIFFHTLVYVPLLNAGLIYAIVRLFTKHPASALFAVTLYWFGFFTLLNLHDSAAVGALPLPLFVLYALLRYDRKPGPGNLALTLLSLALLAGGFCANVLFSPAYFLAVFGLLLWLTRPALLRRAAKDFAELWHERKAITTGLLLCLALGTASLYTTLRSNDHVLRYRGGAIQYDPIHKVSTQRLAIETSPGEYLGLSWFPYPTESRHHGHANRYLGVASLLLIALAAVGSGHRRLFLVLTLTCFTCNWFLTFTTTNLFYAQLLEAIPLLKDVRNMATIFPRGGPPLFLVLAAALGLDALLIRDQRKPHSRDTSRKALWLAAGIGTFLCASLLLSPDSPLKGFDNGFYLGLFLVIFAFLGHSILKWGPRPYLVTVFFFVTLLDLILSQSLHLRGLTAPDGPLERTGVSKWTRLPYSPAALPSPGRRFTPGHSPASRLFPETVPSHYHGSLIYAAPQTWLVLQSNPGPSRILTNWNFKQARVVDFPVFRYCPGARRVSFSTIGDIEALSRAAHGSGPPLIVHEDFPAVSASASPCWRLDSNPETFSYELAETEVTAGEGGVLYFENNWDRYWRVEVDGSDVPLFRANFTFMAVPLSAGTHRVRFRFDPYPVKWLYGAYYLVLAGLGLLFVAARLPEIGRLHHRLARGLAVVR